jgi:cysteine desulfuration protein SufE
MMNEDNRSSLSSPNGEAKKGSHGTAKSSINELQDEVIEEFSDFDDWMDKYQMLIDLGNDLAELDDKYRTEQNLIDGCQSRVWLQCDMKDGLLVFTADSDALIVKGIIALLIQVISGHTPQEILDADLYFIERIGLREHLSPTRSNGLLAMVKRIKAYALAYTMK